jgi:hypothetical protein
MDVCMCTKKSSGTVRIEEAVGERETNTGGSDDFRRIQADIVEGRSGIPLIGVLAVFELGIEKRD